MGSYETFMELPDSDKKKFFEVLQKAFASGEDQPSLIDRTQSVVACLSAISRPESTEKKSPLKQKTLDQWIVKTKVSRTNDSAEETRESDGRHTPPNSCFEQSDSNFESEHENCSHPSDINNANISPFASQTLELESHSTTENECELRDIFKQINSGKELIVVLERVERSVEDGMSEVSQVSSTLQPTSPLDDKTSLTSVLSEANSSSVPEIPKTVSESVNNNVYNLRRHRCSTDSTQSSKSPLNKTACAVDTKKADVKELCDTISEKTNKVDSSNTIPDTKLKQRKKTLCSKNCNENFILSSAPINAKSGNVKLKCKSNSTAMHISGNAAERDSQIKKRAFKLKNILSQSIPGKRQRKKNLYSKALSSDIPIPMKIKAESELHDPTSKHELNKETVNELSENGAPLILETITVNENSMQKKRGRSCKNKRQRISSSKSCGILPSTPPLCFPDSSKIETNLVVSNSEVDAELNISLCNKDDIRLSRSRLCKRNSKSTSKSTGLSCELQNESHSPSFNSSTQQKNLSSKSSITGNVIKKKSKSKNQHFSSLNQTMPTIADSNLETDDAVSLNKNSDSSPCIQLRRRRKILQDEFNPLKCSLSSVVSSISENNVSIPKPLNGICSIDSNCENVEISSNIEVPLDNCITSEKNLEESQTYYESYCELSNLCSTIGVSLDELFQQTEVANSIKTGSNNEVFIIRGHKLISGNVVPSICKKT